MTERAETAAVGRGADRSHLPMAVPALLGAATILSHIAWILVPDSWRDAMTVTGVTLLFLTTATHALATRGPRWAGAYLIVALSFGWAVEAWGVGTGVLFGEYSYNDRLGPALGEVPLVIPMSWAMMAYPVWLAARRTVASSVAVVLFAAGLMTSWDLFLDPQMVDEGHWVWKQAEPALPGVPGIPLQNFVGWLLASLVLMSLVQLLPRRWWPQRATPPDDRVPAAVLLWVYGSNVLASLAFWGRPSVALVGGLVMGAFVLPWLRSGVASKAFWTGTRTATGGGRA